MRISSVFRVLSQKRQAMQLLQRRAAHLQLRKRRHDDWYYDVTVLGLKQDLQSSRPSKLAMFQIVIKPAEHTYEEIELILGMLGSQYQPYGLD